MTEDLDAEACVICGEDLDEVHQATCQFCGGKFHHPWSLDTQVPKCGLIGSHEEALAIVFLCNDCYYGRRP